jgi:hypothetical protein
VLLTGSCTTAAGVVQPKPYGRGPRRRSLACGTERSSRLLPGHRTRVGALGTTIEPLDGGALPHGGARAGERAIVGAAVFFPS